MEMFLVCHMISQDHVISGKSKLKVNHHLENLVVIGTVIVKI